jgi:hypothetical protein
MSDLSIPLTPAECVGFFDQAAITMLGFACT